MNFVSICGATAVLLLAAAQPALAQDDQKPRRTRIALGGQLVPSYPGSDDLSFRPLVDVARARGTDPFQFEAPDESFGFPLVRFQQLTIGPALNFEGSRSAADVSVDLPKVGFTVEPGVFLQYDLSENVRLRSELRKGLGGHEGWVGNIGADFVARRGGRLAPFSRPSCYLRGRDLQQRLLLCSSRFGIRPASVLGGWRDSVGWGDTRLCAANHQTLGSL